MSFETEGFLLKETGGPEVLIWQSVTLDPLGPEDIRIRHTAIGLNFIDIYHRTGLYPMPLPGSIGIEGVGIVEEIGSKVENISVGDRVGYPASTPGAYLRHRIIPADRAVKLPDWLADQDAAAILAKGCTVEFLIRRLRPVELGETVLFHAIAGGVGLLACQWLSSLGVRVIGTAGSEKKADLARQNGAAHVINYRKEDVAKKVRELTDGYGVPVVYDSVGKDSFEGSLNSLCPRGLFVSFGNATGPLDPISPAELSQRGSLFFTRPRLMHYVAEPGDLVRSTNTLFDALNKGHLSPRLNQIFALEHAPEAHRALEARATTGQTVFVLSS